jgi:hypothetical protein
MIGMNPARNGMGGDELEMNYYVKGIRNGIINGVSKQLF